MLCIVMYTRIEFTRAGVNRLTHPTWVPGTKLGSSTTFINTNFLVAGKKHCASKGRSLGVEWHSHPQCCLTFSLMGIHLHTGTCTYTCRDIDTYIEAHVHTYRYTYTEAHTHTDTHRGTHTYAHIQAHTQRNTEYIHTHTDPHRDTYTHMHKGTHICMHT